MASVGGNKPKLEIPLKYSAIRAIGIVLIILFGLFAFYANHDAIVASRQIVKSSTSSIDTEVKKPMNTPKRDLNLTGAPGDEMKVLIIGGSVKGKWASDEGITLELEERKTLLVEPKKRDWEDNIAYSARRTNHDYRIYTSVKIPESANPGESLGGKITGTIRHPSKGGSGFSNSSTTLDVPVEIDVVTKGEAKSLRREEQGSMPLIRNVLLIFVTIGLSMVIASYVMQWSWVRRARTSGTSR